MTDKRAGADAYDQEEVGRACARNQRKMLAICRRVLGNEHDASDAAQDAVVNAMSSPPRRIEKSLDAWLSVVAKHAALDLVRKKARERKLVEKAMRTFRDVPIDDTRDTQVGNDGRKLIALALGFLTKPQRHHFELFRAVAAGERTDAELADEFGITAKAVLARRSRVRKAVVEATKLACLTHDPRNRCAEPIRLTARYRRADRPDAEPRMLYRALRAHVAKCATCRLRLATDSDLSRVVLAVPPVTFVVDLLRRTGTAVARNKTATGMAVALAAVCVTVAQLPKEGHAIPVLADPVPPLPRPLPSTGPVVPTTTTPRPAQPPPQAPPPAPIPTPAPPPAATGTTRAEPPPGISRVRLDRRKIETTDDRSCGDETCTGLAVTVTGDITSVTVEVRLRDRTVRRDLSRKGNIWYGRLGTFQDEDADRHAPVVVVAVAADGTRVVEQAGDLWLDRCPDGGW